MTPLTNAYERLRIVRRRKSFDPLTNTHTFVCIRKFVTRGAFRMNYRTKVLRIMKGAK